MSGAFDSYAGLSHFIKLHSGNPKICIAILDGPVDITHPALSGASIEKCPTFGPSALPNGDSRAHGTHVASLIVGQDSDGFRGVAPRCRVLSIPIFGDREDGSPDGASQIALAHAIQYAIERKANIINISGGTPWSDAEPHPLLESTLKKCQELDILVIAAVGNQGCDCHVLPASYPSILAVGAHDENLEPLPITNWGEAYSENGVLAPGKNILGAIPEAKYEIRSGTSFACAIVSGVAALLASAMLEDKGSLNMAYIREQILSNTLPCPEPDPSDCRRFLGGIVNFTYLSTLLSKKETSMDFDSQNRNVPSNSVEQLEMAGSILPSGDCNCQTNEKSGSNTETDKVPPKPRYVYAIGRIGFSFATQARQDSIQFSSSRPDLPITDPGNLVRHLRGYTEYLRDESTGNFVRDSNGQIRKRNHRGRISDAQGVQWIFYIDAVPVYAIQPYGSYSEAGYEELIDFLIGQHGIGFEYDGRLFGSLDDEQIVSVPITVNRVALAGTVTSGSVTLRTGETVPIVVPEPRGTAAWSSNALMTAVMAMVGEGEVDENRLNEIVLRLAEEARNLGLNPEERAKNYMSTNVFLGAVATRLVNDPNWEFDLIEVRKSAICRPESDCYDVELAFFNPLNLNQARKVVIFTVDVSDVVPVAISEPRVISRR